MVTKSLGLSHSIDTMAMLKVVWTAGIDVVPEHFALDHDPYYDHNGAF